jgi:hypothetical protein
MYADFTEKRGLRGWFKKSQGFLKEMFREICGFRIIRVPVLPGRAVTFFYPFFTMLMAEERV